MTIERPHTRHTGLPILTSAGQEAFIPSWVLPWQRARMLSLQSVPWNTVPSCPSTARIQMDMVGLQTQQGLQQYSHFSPATPQDRLLHSSTGMCFWYLLGRHRPNSTKVHHSEVTGTGVSRSCPIWSLEEG